MPFEEYNPPSLNEKRKIIDGYVYEKITKPIDGKVYQLNEDAENVQGPLGRPQFEKFTLNSSGAATLTVTGLSTVLSDESAYEIFFNGQKKYYSEGDFTYSGSTITSARGAEDEGAKCSILIK